MTGKSDKRTFNVDLGDGLSVVIDVVPVYPVYSTTEVPRPRPKFIARLIVGIGDHADFDGDSLQLDCTFTLQDSSGSTG